MDNANVLAEEAIQQINADKPVDDKVQIKALLAEARNTREMLLAFKAAVESGDFQGHKMLDLAKGVSFLVAIINQNSAHIDNLQERLK